MKISIINKTFLAGDVYSRWKKLVKDAEDSITVFSPYLDGIIIHLLQNNEELYPDYVEIYTCFNAETFIEMPNQLKTIKRLLDDGVSVYSIEKLHAKILVIDDEFVAYGSQNFTHQGRKNLEVSVIPQFSFQGSDFLDVLDEWKFEAVEIESEIVDELLEKIPQYFKKYRELIEEFIDDFSEVEVAHEQEKISVNHFENLEKKSRYRFSSEFVELERQRYFKPEDHYRMVPLNYEDLTIWKRQTVRKKGGNIKLKRLYMYPIIFADSLRIGFARIAKTRITYIRDELSVDCLRQDNISEYSKLVGLNLDFSLTISFPKEDTEIVNISFEFSFENFTQFPLELQVFFDGVIVKPKRIYHSKISKKSQRTKMNDLIKIIKTQEFLKELLSFSLDGFTYRKLGIWNKNVEEYFDDLYYRLSVIEFNDLPILLVREDV